MGTITALLMAATPGLISADNFGTGTDGAGLLADSSLHTFCWGAGFDANLQDNASWAMTNSLDVPTDMNQWFEACTGNTDVVFLDANLPAGRRAQHQCILLSGTKCNSSEITVDPAELNIGTNDEEDTTKSMCHEIGHSVGMRHGDAYIDCMINGEMPSLNLQWRTYSAHHIWHVNSAY